MQSHHHPFTKCTFKKNRGRFYLEQNLQNEKNHFRLPSQVKYQGNDLNQEHKEVHQFSQTSTKSDYQQENQISDINILYNNVGLLISQWKTQDGQVKLIRYGTAFAVTPRIILTCAHNIYYDGKNNSGSFILNNDIAHLKNKQQIVNNCQNNQILIDSKKIKRLCTKIKFIPNHKYGHITKQTEIYQSQPQSFAYFQKLVEDETYGNCPKAKDLAMIYVREDMSLEQYPQIGIFDKKYLQTHQKLYISGYPSSKALIHNQKKSIFQRIDLSGNLIYIERDIIKHDLETSTGFSGSAIICYDSTTKNATIIGVHTHGGRINRSGVYFNKNILKKLINFQLKMSQMISGLSCRIKFHQSIRKEHLKRLQQKLKRKNQKMGTINNCYNIAFLNQQKIMMIINNKLSLIV